MSVDIWLILVLVITLAAVFNSTVKSTPVLKRKRKRYRDDEEYQSESSHPKHPKNGKQVAQKKQHSIASSKRAQPQKDDDIFKKTKQTDSLKELNKKSPKQMAAAISSWVDEK